MHMKGKKVIVTGAARGIGKAIANLFCQEGADVLLTARDTESLKNAAGEIEEKGGRALTMVWDLSDTEAIKKNLDEAVSRLEGLDVLINNAGVLKLPDSSPFEEWDYIMDINLKAVFFLCRAAGEVMKIKGTGAIVNVASDAGLRGACEPYGISKWGVIGLTKGFAESLASSGVRVNAVAPGPVATRMMGCSDGQPQQSESLPLGRFALPEEVASVVMFLATEDSRAVYGETIVVNSSNT